MQKTILDFLLLAKCWRMIGRQNIDVIHRPNHEGILLGFIVKTHYPDIAVPCAVSAPERTRTPALEHHDKVIEN